MFFWGGGRGAVVVVVGLPVAQPNMLPKWRTYNQEPIKGVACPLLLTFEGRGLVVSDMNKNNGYHQSHHI